MATTSDLASEQAAGPPQPPRTISDEFRELQCIVDQFQNQLDMPDGVVGLHPFGSVNVDKAQTSFAQACKRLRESLTAYRGMTLGSWGRLFAASASQLQQMGQGTIDDTPVGATTRRVAAASQELGEMRAATDALYEDISSCQKLLFDAAGDAVAEALKEAESPELLVERLKACAKRLELVHYTDTQKDASGSEVTTVTLAGSISVIDVDIGSARDQMKVKVSYVSDIEHDKRIDVLMLGRLRAGDIHGFERLVGEMALLDRLTQERSPVSFIHNTFAVVATLAEVQKRELAVLDGDVRQLLRYGSGIALPYTRRVGPSTMYFMPPTVARGLTDEDWAGLEANGLATAAELPRCLWLSFAWEPSSSEHCFLSALFQQHCLGQDLAMEDSETHKVVTYAHPTIHGLGMRFLRFMRPEKANESAAMQEDSKKDIDSEFWIPYTAVALLEPELPACALTVRGIMEATKADVGILTPEQATGEASRAPQDSPRLLEDAPTLEHLVYAGCTADATATRLFSATHSIGGQTSTVTLETPQIRAWSIRRIPLGNMHCVLAVIPLLRRQAVFNELVASCFSVTTDKSTEPPASCDNIALKTYANDPFRLDMCIRPVSSTNDKRSRIESNGDTAERADQGVVLRVSETTGDILAWTHQSLAVPESPDLLEALSGVDLTALTEATAHRGLSKAASISSSVPLVAHWLRQHPL
ncbi:hypothetical protein GGF46_000955 [Coemansia sp. RSA 552]|nr:hypothetical protein GGF46_000955 [Coemansia sp. RSA 552]